MFLADRHNFGKQVEKIQRSSGNWFQKPRTVFWEWLFFGKDGPLANVFNAVGKNCDRPLSTFLFNLDIEIVDEWFGYSKDISKAQVERPGPTHFYGFGVLLAYSYIFGIRDLHRQNLIMTETHLQPVDIEVVLTKLVLPSETLLLPFKDIGYEFAAIGRLGDSPAHFSLEQIEQFFFGYFDLFTHAIKFKGQISEAIDSLNISKAPARVIIRNTSEYLRHLSGHQDLDLMRSEKTQIDRGDVPYYFKLINSSELKWLSAPGVYETEPCLNLFRADVDRHSQSPVTLLETNLVDSKMVQGAIQLLRHLKINQRTLSFDLANDIRVDFSNSRISIGSRSYAAK